MNTKRDAGVYQRKNGQWAYRFKVKIDGKETTIRGMTDEKGELLRNKSDAVKARRAAMKITDTRKTSEIRKPSDDDVVTVADVFHEYREKGSSDRAYNTTLKQDSLWKNHISERFGKRKIDEITVAEVNDYLAELYYVKGFAYRYVESFIKLFYLIFGQANSRGYLSNERYFVLCKNKDSKIKMPKLSFNDSMDIVVFTDEECRQMDEYFTGTNAETAYLLGRCCGLRINECFGLKWKDVDLKKGEIRLKQQMQYQQGIVKLTQLKTKHAYRTLYLNDRLLNHLRAKYADLQTLTELERAQRWQNMTMLEDVDGQMISSLELVNSTRNGKMQTVNSMKYHTRMLKERYGITFKYHYLRHTYGTHLAVANTPTHILCKQLGHARVQVTQQYYLGESKEGIDRLKQNLNDI